MTIRGTLFLWMCVLALGVYAGIAARQQSHVERGTPSGSADRAPLLRFDVAAVDGVDITDATSVIRLRREGAGWRDAQGVPWPAPEHLETLLEALADLRPLATIAQAPAQLDAFGLDPPPFEIHLSLGAGRPPLTLRLGERNPAWTGVYAVTSAAPDQVVLLGALILWELEKVFRAARQNPSSQ